MAVPECWSRTVGSRRGARARVYERQPGGTLYVSVWLPGAGESRRSLGHRDRAKAVRELNALLTLRHEEESAPREPLTMAELFRRYATDGQYLTDGSLKTAAYLQQIRYTGENLAQFFGADFPVDELTPVRLTEYARVRREGKITGHEVRTNAIQRELIILKGALNWACGFYEGRLPLLECTPLRGYKVPREKDPKRPVLEAPRMDMLEAVAPKIHPFLPLLIILARLTGRRLSAILHLRWDDIDFESGRIRWRAEHDKLGKTWVIPAARVVLAELGRFRAQNPGIGSALLFPHPQVRRHNSGPVTRHLAAYWLKRAFELAKLEKPEGSLWHMFRRSWVTERKDLPPKDVAAAGGWKDIATLLTCYQQPDEETLRTVVDYQRPRSRRQPGRRGVQA
jgi:integrase